MITTSPATYANVIDTKTIIISSRTSRPVQPAWIKTLVSAEEWKRDNPAPHPLLAIPYLSNQNIEVDELHIIHLGTSMYLFGSALFVLCYVAMPDSPSENMDKIWSEISKWDAGSGLTTLMGLTLLMFAW